MGIKFRSPSLLRHRIHIEIQNVVNRVRGEIHKNTIHAFWFRRRPNFGDFLTPLILEKLLGFTPVYAEPRHAQLASTGSILHLLPPDFNGIILGSGLIQEQRMDFSAATVLAVRGALTRQLLALPEAIPLGDPGLLVNLMVTPRREKKYVLGIVPHYVDKADPRLCAIQHRYSSEVKIIDVQRHPGKVLDDIAGCEYILSSSLHGLIVADAYNIPNQWLTLSNDVIGGGFKFHDYYSALGQSREPAAIVGTETLTELIEWTHVPSQNLPLVQDKLESAFRALPQYLAA